MQEFKGQVRSADVILALNIVAAPDDMKCRKKFDVPSDEIYSTMVQALKAKHREKVDGLNHCEKKQDHLSVRTHSVSRSRRRQDVQQTSTSQVSIG